VSLVSVVTPTYRHASFIGPCIRSVIAQSVQDWEMTVVDDGSDDGTADVAESFPDPRITVIRNPHEGLSALGRSYAVGLARTTSPLVAVLEGDDMWPSTKLEDQLPLMEDPDVVLAYGPAGLIDEHGCLYARHWDAPRGGRARNDPIGSIIPALVRTDFIVTATVIVRRCALEEIGGFVQPSGIPYVDLPAWLRLATKGRFARSIRIAGYWRRHADQWTIRSLFEATPDRGGYLRAAASEARTVLGPKDWAALSAAIDRGPSRQREEATIARGRLELIAGNWGQAAAVWKGLVGTGEPRTRAIAVLGLACAAARTDIEWAIRAAGRHSYPSRRHVMSHR
jgi:glycosyltransferase involved in cell wall biosynthesis